MSYLIKSIENKNVKFAHIYMSANSSTYTLAGNNTSVQRKILFDTITASSNIGVAVSNGDITLSNKNYIIYLVASMFTLDVDTIKQLYCKLYLNNVEIINQTYLGLTDSTSNFYNTVASPFKTAVITSLKANAGDILTMETIAQSLTNATSFFKGGMTNLDAHSIFLWEVDL